MSATAKLLKDAGSVVTGSDESVYEPVSDFLHEQKIAYTTPYAPENIPADVDCIVIGKNAKLSPDVNTEVKEAHARRVRIASFPEILAELSANTKNILVVGSYGKSTTVALLAHILIESGLDPSFFIGAIPFTPQTSARIGRGSFFIIEGDEYPSSHDDARSKFLHFNPTHVLLLPLSHDHLNVFPTEESYLAPFYELMARVPKEGGIVAAESGALSRQFLDTISRDAITYGKEESAWQAADVQYGDTTTFNLMHGGTLVCEVETTLLGAHSVENIVGAGALLISQNIVSPEQFSKAIKTFKGIRRRLDLKSEKTSVRIYEGFGSSIEKARAAIAAMRLHFKNRRLLVVFEPHTFSWRNRGALPWYDTIFADADRVFIYEPAVQGATTHDQITQEEIVERVRGAGVHASPISTPQEGIAALDLELQKDDVVLILTSGNMNGLINMIPDLAESKFPKQ